MVPTMNSHACPLHPRLPRVDPAPIPSLPTRATPLPLRRRCCATTTYRRRSRKITQAQRALPACSVQ
jgi:hypothetical protein